MIRRRLGGALCALAILLLSPSAKAFTYVSGGSGGSGDLVAIWVKNGFELIANLGALDQIDLNTVLLSFDPPEEFDFELGGAKFAAVSVPNPTLTYSQAGVPADLARPNVVLTTLADPMQVTGNQLGDAQTQLDPFFPTNEAWFALLNSVPAANGTSIVVNQSDRLLIQSSLYASYTTRLAVTGDNLGSAVAISIATTPIDAATYQIPLYELLQTVDVNSGTFGTDVTQLGVLSGTDGSSGSATLTLLPAPEPGAAALGIAAMAALAALGRRRTVSA